jgi:microcin C transport system ATP-binding protein
MSLLQLKDLSIQFNGSAAPVVKSISFNIKAGETLALVGESGSGKSITALSLLGLNRNAHYPTGEIIFKDKKLTTKTDWLKIRGREIAMIFQEPLSALNPLHSIGKQLREAILIHNPKLSKIELINRRKELLDEVELNHLQMRLKDYPHQLSGGERQRVMIAMAIANHPQLLVADEPTTALDVSTQAKIMQLLQTLQSKYNMAILLITHDLHLVRRIASSVMVMRLGEIIEAGAVQDIFVNPKHEYTKQLLAATHGEASRVLPNAELLLEASHVAVDYKVSGGFFASKHDKSALRPVSFSLKSGETLGIVGESGSGKTSLGLALARLIQSQGRIVFQGEKWHDFSDKQLAKRRAKLQFVFQDPFASLNPRLNIEQIICEGLTLHFPQMDSHERRQRLSEMLQQVGLPTDIAGRYPHEFSGGQRQRINIARAMILRPALVIFDEPTSALDISLQTQIILLLKKFQMEQSVAYIFISHDIRSIKSISHQLMVLKNGAVVEYGAATQLLQKPVHEYTKMLIDAASY